jgi:uncharacterized protein (TIGR03382 family)
MLRVSATGSMSVTQANGQATIECQCGTVRLDGLPAWPWLVLAFVLGVSIGVTVGVLV